MLLILTTVLTSTAMLENLSSRPYVSRIRSDPMRIHTDTDLIRIQKFNVAFEPSRSDPKSRRTDHNPLLENLGPIFP